MNATHFLFQGLRAGLFAITCAACAGCGGPSGPELHPTRGTLEVDGQPASGAMVILSPVDPSNTLKPNGTADSDGTFTIKTHPHGDGAPAGEYLVLVTWFPPDARSHENAKDKLRGRFSDPTKSSLPKITIKSGENNLSTIKISSK